MISRRSLIQAIFGSTAVGIAKASGNELEPLAQALTIEAPHEINDAIDPAYVIPILKINRPISEKTAAYIQHTWSEVTRGTAFAGRNLLILEPGLELSLVSPRSSRLAAMRRFFAGRLPDFTSTPEER